MKVYATVKSLGRRKPQFVKKEIILASVPYTLREFLTALVTINVEKFNETGVDEPIFPYLTSDEIESSSQTGKIGFGVKDNDRKVNVKQAVSTSLIAFQDGLYKVFINEKEQEDLEDEIQLIDGAEIVFIKMTMLAGRMW
ncbi:hypothetical protein SM124_19625 [Bacillus sp. 31A1R]|uniref:Uncharacterized protein n=1 Tax=Robertmurraya mangrovi TaxID=3098077 RepID=A0ABU5J3E8_9BACI|nr:hypothetical protein [Bacillus sp. 31A1R]MDZ5473934.1 hypothetical protein [Bacillus sp. 31A1R]